MSETSISSRVSFAAQAGSSVTVFPVPTMKIHVFAFKNRSWIAREHSRSSLMDQFPVSSELCSCVCSLNPAMCGVTTHIAGFQHRIHEHNSWVGRGIGSNALFNFPDHFVSKITLIWLFQRKFPQTCQYMCGHTRPQIAGTLSKKCRTLRLCAKVRGATGLLSRRIHCARTSHGARKKTRPLWREKLTAILWRKMFGLFLFVTLSSPRPLTLSQAHSASPLASWLPYLLSTLTPTHLVLLFSSYRLLVLSSFLLCFPSATLHFSLLPLVALSLLFLPSPLRLAPPALRSSLVSLWSQLLASLLLAHHPLVSLAFVSLLSCSLTCACVCVCVGFFFIVYSHDNAQPHPDSNCSINLKSKQKSNDCFVLKNRRILRQAQATPTNIEVQFSLSRSALSPSSQKGKLVVMLLLDRRK